MKNVKKSLLTLTNGLKSSTDKKSFLALTLKKNLLKNRLSIRVRNFAPLNEPLNIFFLIFLFLPRNRPHVETLGCKNKENPRDRKSHTWAPINKTLPPFLECYLRKVKPLPAT